MQAPANELAKNLKVPDALSQFDRLLKKISVEAALNAEKSHHLGYDKYDAERRSDVRPCLHLLGPQRQSGQTAVVYR